MKFSPNHRRWLLGAALLLTIAATASVDDQARSDNEVALVNPAREQVREQPERMAEAEPSADILMDKLKRPALPEKAKDMFAAKSWYVPPPAPKTRVVPVAPPLPFVYVGKLLEAGKSSTVFLERQNRIFLVREGDAIDANYRVDAISAPLMTLTYLPLNIKQTLQIGEAN